MVTPEFTIMQSDVERLALRVVASDLDRYAKITLSLLKAQSTPTCLQVGLAEGQSLGREQQELVGGFGNVFSLTMCLNN